MLQIMKGATVLEFQGRDGLRLVGERRGDHLHAPVVFLHGGGQTRHSWGGTAAAVAQREWQTLTLDARGHGDSAWSDVGDYRLESFAEDVRLVLTHLDEPPILVGASLGGLTSILLTGELAPGAARGVVLVDIVPDMEQAGAMRIGSFMVERAHAGFSSLEEVAESVAAYSPHRPRPTDLSGLRKNVRERNGRFYWHWDPKFLSPESGLGPEEILDVDRMHTATERMAAQVPVLLVRGRASDLVSTQRAMEFCARFPAVEFVDVSGAGHMVAGDRNDAFTTAVLDFLERLADAPDRCWPRRAASDEAEAPESSGFSVPTVN
ncbi:MAG TPA: alpha/beta hydrolase [Acidimicrobiales bacterium]|nr:alpha/beta hydrolase [Acidimicrobiales bacterium]